MDAILVVDDTALPKKGNRSVGWRRNTATTLGKNRQLSDAGVADVGARRGAGGGRPGAVPARDLTSDPHRMTRAGVPERTAREARTKLEIAVAEIDRPGRGGVRFSCVLADAGYGSAAFRQAPSARGLTWAVGIAGAQQGLSDRRDDDLPGRGARDDRASVTCGSGLGRSRNDPGRHDRPGGDLAARHQGSAAGPLLRVARRMADGPTQRIGTKGNQHLPEGEVWLVREERGSGERKYDLTNLPADATLKQLAATIKARWICEQAHQQMKEELGLDHFEGRSWTGCIATR